MVVMGVRNPENCREIVEKSIKRSLWKERVFYEQCDIGDMTSTKNFAKTVQQKFSSIHLLVNNGKNYSNIAIIIWFFPQNINEKIFIKGIYHLE